ncbi:glycosyltransferase family 4 protein [Sinomonas sp. B1-1]|uniref:glycosyltransferase family 4 protein n=1 Tax=Sinomonas sp. B1-1 TaxID=3141454 RepID=UPI003D2CF3E3
MRILIYPHDFGIGGSQLNAVQLAVAAREHGCEVLVYGQPGPLVEKVIASGLEFVESPPVHTRPTPHIVAHLARVVASREVDIVHGYEWPPSVEAFLACGIARRGHAVSTVLSMSVASFIPRYLPLAVGTAQILDAERQSGRTALRVLEPPVDVVENAPGAVSTAAFSQQHGLHPEAFKMAIVSRLSREMKLEGILAAMDAVALLSLEGPAQLVVAGDGPAGDEVRAHAKRVNREAGTRVVVCTGELRDPRPAYAIADVGLGMGSSALRSMAFAIPLVVQGERGYWRTLSPSSLGEFLWQGWYGAGPGSAGSASRLAACLRELRDDRELRARLGRFARETVVARFATDIVVGQLLEFYRGALTGEAQRVRVGETLRSMGRFVGYTAHRFFEEKSGGAPTDDFNSRPLAAVPASTHGMRA